VRKEKTRNVLLTFHGLLGNGVLRLTLGYDGVLKGLLLELWTLVGGYFKAAKTAATAISSDDSLRQRNRSGDSTAKRDWKLI